MRSCASVPAASGGGGLSDSKADMFTLFVCFIFVLLTCFLRKCFAMKNVQCRRFLPEGAVSSKMMTL